MTSNEWRDLLDHTSTLSPMVEGGVAKVEGKPSELQELAQQLVGVNGLLRQPVIPLVIFRISSLVRARSPLQEVLLGANR